MRKLSLALISYFLLIVNAFAEDRSKIEVRASANDEQTVLMDTGILINSFTSSVRQQQKFSAEANTNTAITVPQGAKAVLIDIGTSRGLHLIGAAGDKGISLDNNVPVLLPLSSDGNVTIRISNDLSTTATLKLYWF